MAFRLDDNARNAAADGLVANIVELDIYTGTQPAAGGAPTGTLLGTVTGITWGAAAAGVASVSGSTPDSSADDSGTAGWGRFRNAGGTKFFDGAEGAEFTLADTNIVAGGTITLTSATVTQPAA